MDEALREIIEKTEANTAGLFLADKGLALQAGRLNQIGLDRVADVWRMQSDLLSDGRPVAAESYQVWPLDRMPGGLPLVYIGSKGQMRLAQARRAVSDAAEILATALAVNDLGLTTQEVAAVDRYLASASPDDVKKRQLKVRLDRDGWKIARVAEGMGLSRTTLYAMMDRYGIPRPQ